MEHLITLVIQKEPETTGWVLLGSQNHRGVAYESADKDRQNTGEVRQVSQQGALWNTCGKQIYGKCKILTGFSADVERLCLSDRERRVSGSPPDGLCWICCGGFQPEQNHEDLWAQQVRWTSIISSGVPDRKG